jgi:hypothetical protein
MPQKGSNLRSKENRFLEICKPKLIIPCSRRSISTIQRLSIPFLLRCAGRVHQSAAPVAGRSLTISAKAMTNWDALLKPSFLANGEIPPFGYFARRLSFPEANRQKVVTSSTRSAKHVTK